MSLTFPGNKLTTQSPTNSISRIVRELSFSFGINHDNEREISLKGKKK